MSCRGVEADNSVSRRNNHRRKAGVRRRLFYSSALRPEISELDGDPAFRPFLRSSGDGLPPFSTASISALRSRPFIKPNIDFVTLLGAEDCTARVDKRLITGPSLDRCAPSVSRTKNSPRVVRIADNDPISNSDAKIVGTYRVELLHEIHRAKCEFAAVDLSHGSHRGAMFGVASRAMTRFG